MSNYYNKEDVLEKFDSLDEQEQVSLWGEYCRDYGDYDDEVFYNYDDFFDNMFSSNMEVARAVFYSGDDYNYSDRFVKFNAYGNLKSAAYLKDLADIEDEEFLRFLCDKWGVSYKEED